MTPDTNPDPVKALLEACEPFEHVAEHDISDGEADTDWFVVSFSCPRRLTVRDFRALSRAASVLRERGEFREIAWRVDADEIAVILSEAGVENYQYLAVQIANTFDPPTPPQWDAQKVARLILALDGKPGLTHVAERTLAMLQAAVAFGKSQVAPIGEDQSDLVKREAETRWVIENRYATPPAYICIKSFEEWNRERIRDYPKMIEGHEVKSIPDRWRHTENIDEALQFSRKEDAVAAMRGFGMKAPDDWIQPTEHAWPHISRTSGSAGREMPTRNQIAWALYDREHERSMHADRVVAKMRGREFKDTMEPFEECADVFLGDADAVLALFPAPGKEAP